MQDMGAASICPGSNLSQRNVAHKVYLYLLGQITAAYLNHIWGIDITYVRLAAGWMYLVAILDWFSEVYFDAHRVDVEADLTQLASGYRQPGEQDLTNFRGVQPSEQIDGSIHFN
jgi:hypothetical protein